MEPITYTKETLAKIQNRVVEICKEVKNENPTAWAEAHNGRWDDSSNRYNDLCVQRLRAEGIYAGCNGKRGDKNSRSDDVLTFGLDKGGAADYSGRFPTIAIIDYIGSAGHPDVAKRSVGWLDVSAAAPGYFLDPQGLERIDGGWNPRPNPEPPRPEPPRPSPPQSGRPGLPPDAQLAEFHDTLNNYYRDKLGRAPFEWHVDPIGIGRWSWDYQDLRAQGKSHEESVDEVLRRIEAITGVPR